MTFLKIKLKRNKMKLYCRDHHLFLIPLYYKLNKSFHSLQLRKKYVAPVRVHFSAPPND